MAHAGDIQRTQLQRGHQSESERARERERKSGKKNGGCLFGTSLLERSPSAFSYNYRQPTLHTLPTFCLHSLISYSLCTLIFLQNDKGTSSQVCVCTPYKVTTIPPLYHSLEPLSLPFLARKTTLVSTYSGRVAGHGCKELYRISDQRPDGVRTRFGATIFRYVDKLELDNLGINKIRSRLVLRKENILMSLCTKMSPLMMQFKESKVHPPN